MSSVARPTHVQCRRPLIYQMQTTNQVSEATKHTSKAKTALN